MAVAVVIGGSKRFQSTASFHKCLVLYRVKFAIVHLCVAPSFCFKARVRAKLMIIIIIIIIITRNTETGTAERIFKWGG